MGTQSPKAHGTPGLSVRVVLVPVKDGYFEDDPGHPGLPLIVSTGSIVVVPSPTSRPGGESGFLVSVDFLPKIRHTRGAGLSVA